MKKIIVALVLSLAAPAAASEPYFGLIGSQRLGIQTEQFAMFPIDGRSALGQVDVVVVGHPTDSWSIIPESWQNWVAPEAWGVVAGCGGNTLNLDCNLSVAANAAPQVATLIVGKAGTQTSTVAKSISQALNAGLALPGGATLGFSFSAGVGAGFIRGGDFQSIPAMFPYRGLGPNLYHSTMLGVGTNLKF